MSRLRNHPALLHLTQLVNTLVFVIALLMSWSSASAVELKTFYHNDFLGSPIAATDETGNVLWQEEYLPYGQRLLNDPNAESNPLWYTGKAHDNETGLTYMGARYYDPVVGRFMAIDPVGFNESSPISFNRYAYANDNPYRYVDPDGRVPIYFGAKKFDLVGHQRGDYYRPIDLGVPFAPYLINLDGSAQPRGAARVSKVKVKTSTHGNKLDGKPAEGYTLRSNRTGEILKYGETTRGEDKFGIGSQKRYTKKYLKENDISYVKEISGTKKDMHQWQHQKILDHKAANGGKRPRLNKSDY